MKSRNREGLRVVLTSHSTEGEAVHAGLIVSALEVQSQPEGLAPPHHQPLPAQVGCVVVTAIGLQLQVTSLQDQLCRDREGLEPRFHLTASCVPQAPWTRGVQGPPNPQLPCNVEVNWA